jgi:hypothetical protein
MYFYRYIHFIVVNKAAHFKDKFNFDFEKYSQEYIFFKL